MKYELINPSDDIHFESEDFEVATVATLLVGRGQYSAQPEQEGGREIPLFMFGGFEEWVEKNLNCKADELMKRVKTEKRKKLIAALKSFKIPNGNRSSLNDICGYAHKYADNLSDL